MISITEYFKQKAKELSSGTSEELENDFYNLMKTSPKDFHKMLIEEGIKPNSADCLHWLRKMQMKREEI